MGLTPGNEEVIRDTVLCRYFDPEFLNRIDQILTFNTLTDNWLDAMRDIELARALLAHPDCRRFEANLQGKEVRVRQYVE